MTEFKCPYCNYSFKYEDCDLPYEEDETNDYECDNCGREFYITVYITYDHNTAGKIKYKKDFDPKTENPNELDDISDYDDWKKELSDNED